jgi:hypothetical protein
MNKNVKYAVIIGAVIVGAYVIMNGDSDILTLNQTGSGIATIDSFTSSSASTTGQVYNGDLTVKTIATDLSDPAISYGGDTEYTTICYKDNGSADVDDWTPIATATTANPEVLTVPVSKATGGDQGLTQMYCDIDIGSSQDYYVVKDALIADNSRISSVIFDDPNGDNVDGWVYNVNLIDVSPADPNTTPSLTLFYKLADEGSLTVSDPDSKASVGQGSVANTLKFKLNMDNAGDAEYIQQIQLRVNSTDDGQWFENLSTVTIAGIGEIKLADMVRSDLASTTVYKYTLGSDYSESNLIFIDKNGDTEVDAHVEIQSNFDASNEALCVELSVRTVDAQGSYTSGNSADAEIAEGTNSAECTL